MEEMTNCLRIGKFQNCIKGWNVKQEMGNVEFQR